MSMIEEQEAVSQDANESVESSAPEASQEQTKPSQETAGERQSDEDRFDKHPRWQQLMSERQESQKRLEAYERRLEEMSRKLEQPAPKEQEEHDFVRNLSQINPEWGKFIKDLQDRAGSVEKLQQRLDGYETKTLVERYESSVEKLHEDNKVPAELRSLYKVQIDNLVRSNPKMGLADVGSAYKQIHEQMSKTLDSIKRAERAAYVKEKTSDSKVPASLSKGLPSKTAKDGKLAPTGDRETDLANVVKKAMRISKAENNL